MKRILVFLLAVTLLESCNSGKTALKHGDYYDAVLESVNRLRGSPDNSKAKAVLTEGYPLAISYIETNIKNGIDADDPQKWRNAVQGYDKINYIADQINTSPGAKKVIPKPETRYAELKDAKTKAAEESYQAGIAAMMKNTREDSKEAYFNFKGANDLQPGYRESIEMMTQAEYNATLRIAYETSSVQNAAFVNLQPVINSLQRQFLSFKPISQNDTVPPHQYLKLLYQGYQTDFMPSTTSSTENVQKQIKTGEKTGPDGKKQDVMETVSAKITYFHKVKRASSRAVYIITDAKTNAVLSEQTVIGDATWQHDWATFSGDVRALSASQQSQARLTDANPNNQQMFNQSITNLENNLSQQLKSFYSQY